MNNVQLASIFNRIPGPSDLNGENILAVRVH